MSIIDLPLVHANSSPEDVLDIMRKSARRGFVLQKGSEFRLFKADDLEAIEDRTNVGPLAELGGREIYVCNVSGIASATPEPYMSTELLFDCLEQSGLKFGLISAPTRRSDKAFIYSFDDISMDFVENGGDNKPPIKGR